MGNCIAKQQSSNSNKRENSKELKSSQNQSNRSAQDSQKSVQNQKESPNTSSSNVSGYSTTTVLSSTKTGSVIMSRSSNNNKKEGKNNNKNKNKNKDKNKKIKTKIDLKKSNNGNGPKMDDEKTTMIKKSQKLSTPQQRIEELFNRYKTTTEEDEEVMNSDGLVKFCKDLGIDPEDNVLIVLSYHLNCSELGLIHKQEFLSGLEKLNLDSIVEIKNRIPIWRKELTDTNGSLKQFHKYVFKLGKSDPQHKFISSEMGVGFINLLLSKDFYHAKKFVEFLQINESKYKTMNQDQWMSLFEFITTIKDDLSNYNENAAWACIMDEYVEWLHPKEEEQSEI